MKKTYAFNVIATSLKARTCILPCKWDVLRATLCVARGPYQTSVLKTPKTTTLCTTCHEDKKARGRTNRHVHPPVAKDCVICHDPPQFSKQVIVKEASPGDQAATFACAVPYAGP